MQIERLGPNSYKIDLGNAEQTALIFAAGALGRTPEQALNEIVDDVVSAGMAHREGTWGA